MCDQRAVLAEQRARRINAVLTSCLSWKEAFSITVAQKIELDFDVNEAVGDSVGNVERAAVSKRAFLQDALVYSLRRHVGVGGPENDVTFDFGKTVRGVVRDDVNYFAAIAIAKLFRAHMRTRVGARYGLSWGQHFSYRHDMRRRLRRRRMDRTPVFVDRHQGPGTADEAVELAGQLMESAKRLFIAYQECKSDAKRALRTAVVEGQPCNPDALLQARRIGLSNELPMDRLWDWTSPDLCVYAKHCIGYDEFYNEFVAGTPVQSAKLQRLHGAEMKYKDDVQKKLMARNWWSCGFASGIYWWKQDVDVNRELHQDVEDLVNCIDADETYNRLACNHDHAREMIRTACKGEGPRQIMEALEDYTLDSIYTTLFVIATQNTKPKLQDCWRR